MTPRPLGLVAGLLSIAMVSACGATEGRGADDDRLTSSAAFYPLEYAVAQIGGDHVAITGADQARRRAARPRAQPRDRSPRSRRPTSSSTRSTSSPPSTPPCEGQAQDTGFDVSPAARLDLVAVEDGHDHAGETAGGARRPRGRGTAPATRTSGSTRCATPTSATRSPRSWPRATQPNAAAYRANAEGVPRVD